MLFGKSCKGVREVLDTELSAIFDLQLKDFLNIEGTNCFICKHCDLKLKNIHSLNNQISSLRDEIKPYLEAYQPKSSTSLPISGEKRALSADATAAKRPCLETNMSIPEPSASSSPAISVSL